jgi:uncharacterized protein (DUF58 family)
VRRAPDVVRTAPGATVRVRVAAAGGGAGLRLRERVAAGGGERLLDLAAVPGPAGVSAAYRVAPERRGVVELGPLRLERVDPFGLASSGAVCGTADRLLVHPRWEALRALPGGGATAPDGGLDNGRTGVLTFRSLRDYVPGDDTRRIHWRSSARRDRLQVREFSDTAETRLTVVLDDRAEGGPDLLDGAAEAAACVAATALGSGLPCALLLAGGASADERAGLPGVLDVLAAAPPAPGADLGAALRAARDRSGGGPVVLVSAALTAAELRALAALGGRGARPVAAVVGPGPWPEPESGVTLVTARTPAEFTAAWNEAPWTR